MDNELLTLNGNINDVTTKVFEMNGNMGNLGNNFKEYVEQNNQLKGQALEKLNGLNGLCQRAELEYETNLRKADTSNLIIELNKQKEQLNGIYSGINAQKEHNNEKVNYLKQVEDRLAKLEVYKDESGVKMAKIEEIINIYTKLINDQNSALEKNINI